jgi:hypothetical protein
MVAGKALLMDFFPWRIRMRNPADYNIAKTARRRAFPARKPPNE